MQGRLHSGTELNRSTSSRYADRLTNAFRAGKMHLQMSVERLGRAASHMATRIASGIATTRIAGDLLLTKKFLV